MNGTAALKRIPVTVFFLAGMGLVCAASRGALPAWDFTQGPDCLGWQAAHDVSSLEPVHGGLRLRISGGDPYIIGPARDYPIAQPLWLKLRLKSEQGGVCQIFYFHDRASEENSVRFEVPRDVWYEAKVRLPAQGAGCRLRLDPPGEGGECLLGSLRFEERVLFKPPSWPVPAAPVLGAQAAVLESGDLKVRHSRTEFRAFEVWVAGELMACGNNQEMIGYLHDRQARWLALDGANGATTVVLQPLSQLGDRQVGGTLSATWRCRDLDGGRWEVSREFRLGSAGGMQVATSVSVDQPREVLYLPLFTLLPGLGSFGTNKIQALLAGVEYLENEPSSSTADLNAPASNRQVVNTAKLTFPLMAVAAKGRYLGLAWNREAGGLQPCAVFDSPDRLFGSGGHLMGLLLPGSDGVNREESSLLPYEPLHLPAERKLTIAAMMLGGLGTTLVPAVQHYVRLFGLPPVPPAGMSPADYFTLAGRGWLDSKIRDGDSYRHAAPGFASMPSADAALWMDYLAAGLEDSTLAAQLRQAAASSLAKVAPPNFNQAQVGHVRYPVPALVYGHVAENCAQADAQARGLLGRFESDGFVRYRRPGNGLDYGRTHWAPDANGLTAQVLHTLLEEAAFAGNRTTLAAALHHLRAVEKFRNSVPRGAQTWEIPLHTPDILASAYLVRAYTLAYELTGDSDLLEQARYWAWTGVPFVYLSAPTDHPVGVYSTIPVLGATAWVAPVWIGLPVQWCGLVYADALYRFARHDPSGPWRQLADGIAIAGVQQTYPLAHTEYRGLLPDSYNLRAQARNGPNINPATLLAPASRLFNQPWLYDFRALNRHGLLVHAPGRLSEVVEAADRVSFKVHPWSPKPSYLLINGFSTPPGKVLINGQTQTLTDPHQYQPSEGRLILQLPSGRGQFLLLTIEPQ